MKTGNCEGSVVHPFPSRDVHTEQCKSRSYGEGEQSPGVKEQLLPRRQLLILQMKLRELPELLQTLHHCNAVSTKIPTA